VAVGVGVGVSVTSGVGEGVSVGASVGIVVGVAGALLLSLVSGVVASTAIICGGFNRVGVATTAVAPSSATIDPAIACDWQAVNSKQ
jgi:hypothetical protein